MFDIADLLSLADEFIRATSIKEVTLSYRLFDDSKKITALRTGADMYTGSFNAALVWFSQNWPADATWPSDVTRPDIVEAAE